MQMSNTSKAPVQLKYLCNKYNNIKKDIKKTKFEEKEFKKIHKDILCQYSKYIHKINKLKRREDKLFMRIGMFTHPQCPLPLMIRRKFSRS
jgi:DNA-directed RNA polymerase sigma subunit (sigma70/sigma32)